MSTHFAEDTIQHEADASEPKRDARRRQSSLRASAAEFAEEALHHAEAAMHLPDETEQQADVSEGCGPMKRYPLLSVVCFALVGLALGLGLSFWEPSDPEAKNKAIKWIGYVATYLAWEEYKLPDKEEETSGNV